MNPLAELGQLLDPANDLPTDQSKEIKLVISPTFCCNYPKNAFFKYTFKDKILYHSPSQYLIQLYDNNNHLIDSISYKLQRVTLKKPTYGHLLIINYSIYIISIAANTRDSHPTISLHRIDDQTHEITPVAHWTTTQLISLYKRHDNNICTIYSGRDLWHLNLNQNFDAITSQTILTDKINMGVGFRHALLTPYTSFGPSLDNVDSDEPTEDFRNPFLLAMAVDNDTYISMSHNFRPVTYTLESCIVDNCEVMILLDDKLFSIKTEKECIAMIHAMNKNVVILKYEYSPTGKQEYSVHYFNKRSLIPYAKKFDSAPEILNSSIIIPNPHDKVSQIAIELVTNYQTTVIFKKNYNFDTKNNINRLYYFCPSLSGFPILCNDKGSFYELEVIEPPISRPWELIIPDGHDSSYEVPREITSKTKIMEGIVVKATFDLSEGIVTKLSFDTDDLKSDSMKDMLRKGFLIFENNEEASHYGIIEYDPYDLQIQNYNSYYASKYIKSDATNDYQFMLDSIISELDFNTSQYNYVSVIVSRDIGLPYSDYIRYRAAVPPTEGFIVMTRIHDKNYIGDKKTMFSRTLRRPWFQQSKPHPSYEYRPFDRMSEHHNVKVLDYAFEERPIFIQENGTLDLSNCTIDEVTDCITVRIFRLYDESPIPNHEDLLYVYETLGGKYIIEAVTENIEKPKHLLRFLEAIDPRLSHHHKTRGARPTHDAPRHPLVKSGSICIDLDCVKFIDMRISSNAKDTASVKAAIEFIDSQYGDHSIITISPDAYLRVVFE